MEGNLGGIVTDWQEVTFPQYVPDSMRDHATLRQNPPVLEAARNLPTALRPAQTVPATYISTIPRQKKATINPTALLTTIQPSHLHAHTPHTALELKEEKLTASSLQSNLRTQQPRHPQPHIPNILTSQPYSLDLRPARAPTYLQSNHGRTPPPPEIHSTDSTPYPTYLLFLPFYYNLSLETTADQRLGDTTP